MIADSIPQIKAMNPSQKLLLASELWDEAMAENFDIPPSDDLMAELERRSEEYRKNPELAVPWEDARKRILSSKD